MKQILKCLYVLIISGLLLAICKLKAKQYEYKEAKIGRFFEHHVQKSAAVVASSNNPDRRIFIEDRPKLTKCFPKRKVGFMKTHKTASSVVQNIILRYGMKEKLNFLLPPDSNHLNDPQHIYELKEPFQLKWVKSVKWHDNFVSNRLYDVVALHTKWNHDVFSSLLGPKSTFFTILRDPVDTFESLYNYVGMEEFTKLSLQHFIKSLPMNSSLASFRAHGGTLGLSQQMWDLGMSAEELKDAVAVDNKIKETDSNFHLVMISERLDESLVLLSHLLCWPLHHFRSLKLNARKSTAKTLLTEDQREVLRSFQSPDQKLYIHFKAKFDRQVEAFGREKMQKAVEELRRLNRQAEENCVLREADQVSLGKRSKFAPINNKVVAFKIRKGKTSPIVSGWEFRKIISLTS